MITFVKTNSHASETLAGTSEPIILDRLDLAPATTHNSLVAAIEPPVQVPVIDRTTAYEPPTGEEKAHQELLDMLTYKRPARSKSEGKFINRFLIPLKVQIDKYGNFYKAIGTSPILWSCHIDTVHNEGGRQIVGFDMAEIGIAEKEKSNCLGGDDTCGVWLMVQMIKAKVPGLYIFHRDEEVGRKGSEWLARFMSTQLKDVKFAIALDRKGTDSIITHQTGKRCCSDEFTKSLAEQLDMGYKGDDTGSYTDTASYVDIIGECTNLSVGYRNAHQATERIDREHLFKLRDKLILLDPVKLADVRVAGTKEYKSYSSVTYGGNNAYNYGMGSEDYSWPDGGHFDGGRWIPNKTYTGIDVSAATRHSSSNGSNGRVVYGSPANKLVTDDDDEVTGGLDIQKDYDLMVKLIVKNPEAVADILEQYGYGYDELSAEILQCGVLHE